MLVSVVSLTAREPISTNAAVRLAMLPSFRQHGIVNLPIVINTEKTVVVVVLLV